MKKTISTISYSSAAPVFVIKIDDILALDQNSQLMGYNTKKDAVKAMNNLKKADKLWKRKRKITVENINLI